MKIILTLGFILICQVNDVFSAQCACATTDVNVRDGAGTSHSILTVLMDGHCLPYTGNRQTVSGYDWLNVDYNGQDGWIHSSYVSVTTCSSGSSSGVNLPGCPTIVTRAEWGARSPTHAHSSLPGIPKYLFIHHGASGPCDTKSECIAKVKSYQNYHMDGHGWSDIGYSFVVGEDGNVYEARGWDAVGAHTKNYNSVGLGVCIIGDFTSRVPNDAALNAVKQLIQCGVDNGKLSSSYILQGHRDVGSTECPGTRLYNLIQTWPHYP